MPATRHYAQRVRYRPGRPRRFAPRRGTRPTVTHFGYDATVDKSRRQSPASQLYSEEQVLKRNARKKLVNVARELRRNFSVARWMLNQHLDWVAMVTFQSRCASIATRTEAARTELEALDRRREELVAWWAKPWNFDIAGRHGLFRSIRIAEGCRVVDGDLFYHKLSDGRTQALEGDLIRDSRSKLPDRWKGYTNTQGVLHTEAKRAAGYEVCKRSGNGRFDHRAWVASQFMTQFAYWDRFDQLRGVTPLAGAINTLRDAYEGATWALLKMKIAQMFGLVTQRESGEPIAETDGAGDTDNEQPFTVDLTAGGPFHLDIGVDDKASFLETNSPPDQFQSFWKESIIAAMKALDLPYSFYDEKHTNFFGSRAALIRYLLSSTWKRLDVDACLDDLLSWRETLWFLDGVLDLPASLDMAELRHRWMHRGVPWWNPVQEVKGSLMAIRGVLSTYADELEPMGRDFRDVVDRLAEERKYIAEVLGQDALDAVDQMQEAKA